MSRLVILLVGAAIGVAAAVVHGARSDLAQATPSLPPPHGAEEATGDA
jgi:hypothetical protein